jgi:fructokinase
MSVDLPSAPSPVVFGEVLFDHFADGSRVLGGAPFNLAWHLTGFGIDPLVITAVGADAPGDEAIERMQDWGMRTKGVQRDRLHPTGRVAAKLVGGEPTFEIGVQQAYDYIDPARAAAAAAARPPPLLYHGTLALRGDRSWLALQRVLEVTNAPTFVDLNLRAPWWTRDRLRWCLATATWLKLSQAELATVAGTDARGLDDDGVCARAAREVSSRHDVGTMLITRGAAGSMLVAGDHAEVCSVAGGGADAVVDTVGAGDAFSAVACLGVLEGWRAGEILRRGNAFAADICRIRGATAEDRALYARHRDRWRREPGSGGRAMRRSAGT